MPRIDPIQLLNCLSVLLSTNGGIKSRDEVQRLANLMTKFSKKLVSKCIYIQILKCTETELLGLFMGSGGWRLVHMWLTESIVAKNWPLVRELLELLLLCPVDIERLKTNNCPKLVKELSKDGNHFAIRALASKLVEQWLKSVKGEHVVPIDVTDIPQIIADGDLENNCDLSVKNDISLHDEIEEKTTNEFENKPCEVITVDSDTSSDKRYTETSNTQVNEETDKESETLPVLKITVKDGKQVISQVNDNENKQEEKPLDKEKSRDKHKSKSKEKSHDRNSSKSSSSKHSNKSHSSSSDKYKSSHKDSPSRHSSKERSKDKHPSSSSKSKHGDSSSRKSSDKSSSSSRAKEERSTKQSSDKDKNKEKSIDDRDDKNKDNSQKSPNEISDSKTPSIHKLGKIPKISDLKKEKPSISIEVRKPDDPKPKTVKTFNSKFRKHGLEEEVKPPPSRASLLNKKPPPILPPTVATPKRSSPIHNEPPEKKPKTIETIEKPGAIKLIPPKPKREHRYPGTFISISFHNSLGCLFVSGKSKMYSTTGLQMFTYNVKYLLQINAEIIQYMYFDKF